MATSESACLDFCDICMAYWFYIVVMLSGLLFTRRVPTNKPFPFPLCHVLLQNQPQSWGWKNVSKVICHPTCCYRPPALQIEIFRAYNRVKRNHDTAKMSQYCVKYFQSYKSIDSMKERRHTGTSTDEPLQMNLYRWTDKLFLLPPSPHQGRGGTAESFNR